MKLRYLIIICSIAVAILVGLVIFYEFRIHKIRRVAYSQGKADAMLVENQKIIEDFNRSVVELEAKTKEYHEIYEKYTEQTKRISDKIDTFITRFSDLDNSIQRLQGIWARNKN